jgi:hypothetical protein
VSNSCGAFSVFLVSCSVTSSELIEIGR